MKDILMRISSEDSKRLIAKHYLTHRRVVSASKRLGLAVRGAEREARRAYSMDNFIRGAMTRLWVKWPYAANRIVRSAAMDKYITHSSDVQVMRRAIAPETPAYSSLRAAGVRKTLALKQSLADVDAALRELESKGQTGCQQALCPYPEIRSDIPAALRESAPAYETR